MHSEVIGNPDAACMRDSTGGERDENEKVNLRRWLATDAARTLVEKASGCLARDISSRGLWGAVPGFGKGKAPFLDEALEEIRSELTLFLCERTGFIKMIVARGGPGTERYLRAAFINHLIDKSRRPVGDPRRYLYKRTLDCCRDSEDISISDGPSGGRFISLKPAVFLAAYLAEEDFSEIPFPENIPPVRDIASVGKKRVLLPLAVHFATGVARLYGRDDVGVAVRDFIAWLACHLDLKLPVEIIAGAETAEPACDGDLISVEKADIARWAGCFAARLSRKEAVIFYLYYGRDLSLADIAEALGLRNPSGVHYHLNNTLEKCRRFIKDLPGISSEDFDEQAFLIFQDALFKILKKYAPAPYAEDKKNGGVGVEVNHAES